MKKFVKFTKEENKTIVDYCDKNFEVIFNFIKNTFKYTEKNIKITISNSEFKTWQNIPISEKYKLQLPKKIYRGITLSDKIIKETIIKFKKQNKKLNYKSKKQFSSWSTSKDIANDFSQFTSPNSKYKFGLVFESNITNKNKFIDINLFFCVCTNMLDYLSLLLDNEKLSEKLYKLYFYLSFVESRYNEQEIIVFGKLKVENIYKSK